MKKKAYIYTVGCHRRLLDSTKIENYLKLNNFEITKSSNKADYIIINTCAFKQGQEDFSIKKIQEFSKKNKKLIVGGCLPEINKKRLEEIFKGPTFSPISFHKIDEIFKSEIKFQELSDTNKLANISPITNPTHFKDLFRIKIIGLLLMRLRRVFKRSYYIRISWGCLGKCSYCAIKNAIGPLKSKPLNECLLEFKNGLTDGHKDFILVADDLGAYGIDIDKNFPLLLNEFLKIKEKYTLSLFELHPRWIVKYLEELIPIVKSGKIIEILCPIQSGSNEILEKMNRFHTAEEIKFALKKIREVNPKIRLITHVIVGFPGETEQDFQKTIDFLREVKFNYSALYSYSEKLETIASNLPNKISEKTIKERIKKAKKMGC